MPSTVHPNSRLLWTCNQASVNKLSPGRKCYSAMVDYSVIVLSVRINFHSPKASTVMVEMIILNIFRSTLKTWLSFLLHNLSLIFLHVIFRSKYDCGQNSVLSL